MSGTFIVLDGPDGSGTTRQSEWLAENLKDTGKTIVLTKEPTDGTIGSWVRSTLSSGAQCDPTAIQLMFCADRAEHVADVITPALERGDIVISDRYTYSTIVYGDALGLDGAWLESINAHFPSPDLTIFTLPPLDVCMARLGNRDENDAFEGQELQQKVHAAYARFAARHDDIHIIDTSGSKKESSDAIAALALDAIRNAR